MKLHQLISVDAVVRHDLSLTRAAAALNSSQPALSMHIQLLEAELRTQLFIRQRNRFIGLSPAGEMLLPIAARAVAAANELRQAAREFQAPRPDTLTIAASQTLVRYTLPPIIERFSKSFPNVKLRVRHGSLTQTIELLMSGDADFALSTSPKQKAPDLLSFPCHNLGWLLVTKPGHPLLRLPILTLADIAAFPIITYDEMFASHDILMQAFRAQGLAPNLALMESDSDIMKQYVRSGIGVAVIKDGAFQPECDPGLNARKLDGLVPDTPIEVSVRRNAPLNQAALGFIQLMQPKLATTIRRRLATPYR